MAPLRCWKVSGEYRPIKANKHAVSTRHRLSRPFLLFRSLSYITLCRCSVPNISVITLMFLQASKGDMPIRVLLADNSDVMRSSIVRIFAEDPELELVGEATNFAETLQLTAALKPDILVLDLHMPDEDEYSPPVVKSQVLLSIDCILAISIWNDNKAKALADSLGAKTLLDKAKLYSELIPSIKFYCLPDGSEKAAQDLAQPAANDFRISKNQLTEG